MPSGARSSRPASAPPAAGSFDSPWVQLRSASANPLIYQRMVRDADRAARPGDVVNVYDKQGDLFGRALFNPRSQIALRMLTWGSAPVDDAFWRQRLADAVELRRRLRIEDDTDACRLVHAEGDGLSGLIVERYADCLVFELFSLGMQQRAAALSRVLTELLGPPAVLDRPQKASAEWRIFVRADEKVQRLEGFSLEQGASVSPPGNLVIREHGVRYRVDVAGGHKTGFFCDQRANRKKLAGLCRDAALLDVCCYTGGFALCARRLGGAREVTAVDLDETALALARENANLNQARIDFVHADAFVFMRQMLANKRQFDAVVLDPPKFAPTRSDLDEAQGKYYDLNVLGAQLVRPGGFLLTCSCSGLVGREEFLETVLRAVRRTGRQAQIIEYGGAAPDHPVMTNCPESAYLKALWLRVL